MKRYDPCEGWMGLACMREEPDGDHLDRDEVLVAAIAHHQATCVSIGSMAGAGVMSLILRLGFTEDEVREVIHGQRKHDA